MNRLPMPGEVIGVGAAASTQFGGNRKLVLRVITIDSRPTYYGWCWVVGYVLDRAGEAVEKRELFVRVAGLALVGKERVKDR
ncbi:hypothetical protein [Plantactinospora sp. WMMB782]|uniref:hypothetical protein n=1 Tax=Plantactinospora sp. WMMB782 TaxID=3404121 RepID=UPI003B932C68